MKVLFGIPPVSLCSFLLLWLAHVAPAQKLPHRYGANPAPDIFYGEMDDRLQSIDPMPPGFERKLSMPCPPGCRCSRQSCGIEVDCSGLQLSEVPRNLSPLTECLDLSMNNISEITAESFAGLKDLRKLCLSGNFISELPPDVFPGFRRLQTLLLQDNLLSSIPSNTLSKMPSLKDLNLGANYIQEISQNAFAKLDSLEHIWLDDNSLSKIPTRALSKARNIKALTLDMNHIEVIKNGDLKELSQLKVLLLKHNRISKIEPNAFEGAINIQIVDLSFNEMTSFPPAIKCILGLQQLTLNHNKIKWIPDVAFAGNPELRHLGLFGNPLKSVGRTAFSGLRYLESLSIRDASDQEDFPDFFGCSSLKELTIVGTKISSIPQNLCSNLPNLKVLTLSRNRLSNLSGLGSCGNLTSLDASGNDLSKLSKSETRNLGELKNLDLSSNRIRQVEQEAFLTTSLVKMNLGYNSFTYLPVRGLGNLQQLNVSGVRTLLYVPPKVLLPSLNSLVAFYPYHCCQLAKTSADLWKPAGLDQAQSGIQQNSRISWEERYTTDVPTSLPIQCSPDPGPLTPCDDLLPSTPLRIFSWFSMIVSFLLNGLILLACGLRYCVRRRSRLPSHLPSDEQILRQVDTDSPYPGNHVSRMVSDSDMVESRYCLNLSRGTGNLSTEDDSFDISLCHLAFADVIVTAYTAVILSYDHSTRGNFAEHGAWWQQSAPCHSAGFLLTFGTQLAFSTVAVMSVERYLATMHPLQPERHMRKTMLILTLLASWVISLATATVTLFGGGSEGASVDIPDMLPAQNGAACLPWTTEFAYVAVLFGVHILVCLMATILCIRMFCARRKQSWLSPRKNSRRQVTLAVAFNIVFILPLAIVALYVSGVMTYSDVVPGEDGEYYAMDGVSASLANDYGRMVLDMGRVLAFVMFAIPLRPLLNPVLYISFNGPLRRDVAYLCRKMFFSDPKPHRLMFPPHRPTFPPHRGVVDTMYNSSVDSREESREMPIFNETMIDRAFLQTIAYDNGEIANSSLGHHTVDTPTVGSMPERNPAGTDRRRRRSRRSRSRRSERRTATETDPTTESEVITFHRGDESVRYDPGAQQKRRKKLSVRGGGVNARDDFQRLIFPRLPMASSSSNGSNSTIYPLMPGSRSGLASTPHGCYETRVTSTQGAKPHSPTSSVEAPPPESTESDGNQNHRNHYDLSALNTFGVKGSSLAATIQPTSEINNNVAEHSDMEACMSYEADMEVAGITSSALPSSSENGVMPIYTNMNAAKQSPRDSRKKAHQRARSHEEDYLLVAMRNASRNDDSKNVDYCRRGVANLSMTRKDSADSHSSGCDGIPLGRGGKILSSCEYCDSSASKDSGIHSELDSGSGASYSDTSIGRRLHYSALGAGKSGGDVSTIREREIDRFERASSSNIQEFQIVPTILNDSEG